MPRAKFDDTLDQLATRIPARLHKAVRLAALEEGVYVRDWVADALTTHLREVTGGDESAPQSRAVALRRPARARG